MAAESEKLRSTLLSSVSHDLRTPLAAITGAASALRDDAALSPPVVHELASTVLDEAERLNRLVRNLLDMTRLESGTLAPRRDWHSIEELVGSALARVERYGSDGCFTARVDPDLPLVAVDAVLVEQALVNLLENALRHGGHTGRVEVTARREGNHALIEVCDEGPGFPAEEAERIFEKFHRAAAGPGSRTRPRDHAGDRHRPRGDDPGRPARAEGRLLQLHPAARRASCAASTRGERAVTAEARERTASEPLVLVIEDEPQLVRFLRATLPPHGYRMVDVPTAAQGLVEAASRTPDLVLLDLGLPDLDGVEVVRRIRRVERHADRRASPRAGRRRTRSRPSTPARTTT